MRSTRIIRLTFKNSTNPKTWTKSSDKPLAASLPQTELFHNLRNITPITNRPVLINEDSCRDLIRGMGLDKIHDLVVIEPYSGPGGLTRALLELKNVKRVIAIENAWRYMPLLEVSILSIYALSLYLNVL